MRKLVVIISEKDARVVLLASTYTSVSGAVRKAMGHGGIDCPSADAKLYRSRGS